MNPNKPYPKVPSTQYSRTLVPKTIKGMVLGTRDLEYWVLGPCGLYMPYMESRADVP